MAASLVSLRLCRSFKIAQVWIPVNIIFVGMIWTSFFALKNLGVPMATVLKNLTNLFTIGGDYLLYGKVREHLHPLQHVWLLSHGPGWQPAHAQGSSHWLGWCCTLMHTCMLPGD